VRPLADAARTERAVFPTRATRLERNRLRVRSRPSDFEPRERRRDQPAHERDADRANTHTARPGTLLITPLVWYRPLPRSRHHVHRQRPRQRRAKGAHRACASKGKAP
jgi:hypothetical protein